MGRVKSNSFYVIIFLLVLIAAFIVTTTFQLLSSIRIPISGVIEPLVAANVAAMLFFKNEGRYPEKTEIKKLIRYSFLANLGVTALGLGLVLAGGFFASVKAIVPEISFAVFAGILLVLVLILSLIQYWMIHLGFTKFRPKNRKNQQTVFEQVQGEDGERKESRINQPQPQAQAQAASVSSASTDESWSPVDDRGGFSVREERAPWFKYAVGILALGLVGGGAIWLASKVVIADDVPTIERADKTPVDKTPPQAPKSEDDLAWVKALEIDTVEGYRAYIADFPNGRHVEDAQRLINEFDDEAWKLAEERDTIAGYEDYLESWPDGLHVTEAKARIAEIKAEEEARRKDAAEAARQEAAAWQAAAQTNTIPSYEGYLSKYPTGKNASEAQTRIDRLRAEEAQRQASAADEAAWNAANATGTADAYQQYLTSFPQGAHVPEAIAKLEELRPGPGKTFKDCAACPTMVSLPAGTAELGAPNSDSKAKPNEKPARPVTFSNLFAIGVTEVTFAQYGACVSAGGCKSMPSDNGWGQGNRPVINVSWSDAVAYAQWLSNTTGKNYGLPSDAQWEYAARGGKTDTLIGGSPKAVCAFANGASKESELPWANNACTDLAADRTLPAGSLSKNGFGVADMIGNVSEWTMDCNTLNLRDAPVDGSADARGSCSQRIVRGGSWFSGPDDLRYSARAVQRRGDTNDFTGFRVVRN